MCRSRFARSHPLTLSPSHTHDSHLPQLAFAPHVNTARSSTSPPLAHRLSLLNTALNTALCSRLLNTASSHRLSASLNTRLSALSASSTPPRLSASLLSPSRARRSPPRALCGLSLTDCAASPSHHQHHRPNHAFDLALTPNFVANTLSPHLYWSCPACPLTSRSSPSLPHRPLDSGMNVDYRTIPQKDLAKFVLSEGGWSKLLCTREKVRRLVDVALVFVGKEMAIIPRPPHGHGWLRPAIGTVELSQSIIQLQRRRRGGDPDYTGQRWDDEAVYYKVAGDCPKRCVYSLRSLWRKKRRYVDLDASTSQMLAQRGMGNFMILSNGSETELLYSVSDPLLIRDGSETEYNNSVDPLLIRDGSEMESNNSVSNSLLIRDGSETECNYDCTL
ncbi:hypothetical protein Scep_027754 [Stephania cephalantha]|uniref:Uncharacterized protein n=1 Tax=Stephania cephalantha TaxID=152367 RepID=A0AAP0EBX2_9MAGN